VVETVLPARLGKPFRWLVGSSWVGNLGDGITLAAGPLLVASQTSDPPMVALAGLLQRLPWLVFGLYAGVLADRVSRKALVTTVDLMRAAVLAVLAGPSGSPSGAPPSCCGGLAHTAHGGEALLVPSEPGG
jgi:MFS family permease